MLLMFCCTLIYAQVEIGGTVVDGANEPIIGATVMEKGTTNGAVTDLDGHFKLKVKQGAVLVFTYIGYATLEQKAEANMRVQLKENAKELNEVDSAQGRPDRFGGRREDRRAEDFARCRPHACAARQGSGHEYYCQWFTQWHGYGAYSWYRFVQYVAGSTLYC